MSRTIGYARVSTDDQDLSLQMNALDELKCSKIFTDKVSGAKKERPGLDKCLEYLNAGDTLVVWRLDRLGRSLTHLISVVGELNKRRINFKSLSDGIIDTTTASGELIFNIFASVAQFERRLIQERTNAGLAAARARGKPGGRPKLQSTDQKVLAAKALHKDHNLSIAEICEKMNVSRSMLYRYLKVN